MVGRIHRDNLGGRLLGVLQAVLNLGNDGLELGVASATRNQVIHAGTAPRKEKRLGPQVARWVNGISQVARSHEGNYQQRVVGPANEN